MAPRHRLVDADVIVVGSAASLDPAQVQKVLDAVEPDAYVVKLLPDHPTIGAVAVRRSTLSATWLHQVVDAVQSVLDSIMSPDLVWLGTLDIEVEARAVVELPDLHEAK